ncbi:phytoene/squalene synthase family protein [Sandaracinobacteroides saxicola]|uniref:Phytoene/squalene synthase family protein n=1 Tax=Sandaracinobacteroides saxicola TaxID=2759707 RepID=A0A7G5IF98_9SPHN|nr:phytoene/squalene synthase family protein [Sandaracinobacteroides saxicola]QMW22040.1 phytoene/squalene synthase family protein [Sandaracinobacteroides saxicola]
MAGPRLPPEAIAASRAAIAAGSKSFALAARLFDPDTRDRATLLYHWCRHCDDVIDGQHLGQGRVASADSPAERLAMLRDATDRALAGDGGSEPAFRALAALNAVCPLPRRYAHDLLDGFAMDVAETAYQTEAELLTYCYHVAGCVGVLMALVMGVEPSDHATLARASDLGLSFQLNNIARDVMEDAANGRRYLPADWLREAGIPVGDFAEPAHRARLAKVVARLVALAEVYEESADWGVAALDFRSAWAVLSAARIYGDIGRKVRRRGMAALSERVVTSPQRKLRSVAGSLPQALARRSRWAAPSPERVGLWTPDFA